MKKRNFKLLLTALIVIFLTMTVVSAADPEAGQIVTPAIVGTVFLLGLYGAFKFAEQSWGSDPTQWSYLKYFQVFAAAIIVSAVTYLASGVLTAASIEQITQALALLGGTVLTILGYKTVKNVGANGSLINPEVVKPAVTGPTTTEPTGSSGWNPDFSVLPTFPKVKSGAPITFALQTVSPGTGPDTGIHRCKEVMIDWMDGSPIETVPMGNGLAQVVHTYIYNQGSSQYYTHSFFPEFTTVDALDGSKKSFNTDGRSCAPEIESGTPGTYVTKPQ